MEVVFSVGGLIRLSENRTQDWGGEVFESVKGRQLIHLIHVALGAV